MNNRLRILYLQIFLLSCIHFCYSQNRVEGVVINGTDNSKLAAASIFINNSSKGTISDNNGKFILNGITETNFELVISYSGFETVSLKITPENIHTFFTVKLFPRKIDLAEVKIMSPEKDGWEKWGKLFTENFIGLSDFASECSIENPEVLRFFYDKQNDILKAYSHGNLIIHNRALGYIIRYQLEEFKYDGQSGILTYIGYSGFEDLDKNKERKRWQKNRREAYLGSIMHFMRSVYANTTLAEGFEVREKIRIYRKDSAFAQIFRNRKLPQQVTIDTNEYIPVAGENSLKKIPEYIDLFNKKIFSLDSACTFDSVSKQKTFYFVNYLQVVYKNAKEKTDYLKHYMRSVNSAVHQTSEINLVNDQPIIIEADGLYFDPLDIISSGYWGWCKMAETLPSDYQLKN